MMKKSLLTQLGWLGCMFAVAIAAGMANSAHAALLAYDPFEFGDVAVPSEGQYALGDEEAGTNLLGGQDPTIGPTAFYTGPWIQSGGDSQVVKAIPSLTNPKFQPGIGGVQQETVVFDFTAGRTGREIAGGLGAGRDPRTLYQSFLIDYGTQGSDDPADFGKRGYEMWNGGVGDDFLAVDLFLNAFSGVNELSLAVTTAGNGTTTVPLEGGGLDLPTLDARQGDRLAVLKFEFNPTDPDVVSVYLDPTDSVESNWTPAASVEIPTSDLFITHHSAFTNFTFSGGGFVPGAIDEIRWGENFADVVSFIPEPTSLSLCLVSMMGMLLRRGRS